MNEEEKQAIEYWKTHLEILHCNTQIASEHYIKVLLDLVEKQQTEIEELGDRKAENYYHWQHLEAKIINKIQEIESYAYTSLEEKEKQDYAIYELKRLLEE